MFFFSTYKDLEEQSGEQNAKVEKRSKESTFLLNKAQEYAKLLSKLKVWLQSSAFIYDITELVSNTKISLWHKKCIYQCILKEIFFFF